MKKIAVAVVLVMVLAGSAFAAQTSEQVKKVPGHGPAMMRQELTPEARAHMDEMAKLHEELRAELQKESPDKAKARGIHDKITALRTKFDNELFEKMLANPQMFKRQQVGQERKQKMPEISAADKAKFNEMHKLHMNIQAEMQKDTPNKSKIRDWVKQAQAIRNSMEDARLEEILKDPAKYKNAPIFGFGPMNGPGHKGFKCGPAISEIKNQQ